jgi:hypothetical protein
MLFWDKQPIKPGYQVVAEKMKGSVTQADERSK